MTSIIILEGIPTSGKSYLQELVYKILKWEKRSVELITEVEINTPFARKQNLSDTSPAKDAPEYLKELLQKKLSKKKDYLICENLHLFYLATNNLRGEKETLKDYKEIETMLEVYPTLLVHLEIEGRYILSSFRKRIARYELQKKVDPFKSFLEAKGTEFNQLAYYQRKQNKYKEYLKETKVHTLHLLIKNKTDYQDLANQIVRKIHEIEGGWHYKK